MMRLSEKKHCLFSSRSLGSSFLGGSLFSLCSFGSLSGFLGSLSLGLGLGSCDFSLLLGYCLSLSLVFLSLFLKSLLGVSLLVAYFLVLDSLELSNLLGFPSIETTLSFLFVESAFLNTALEMLHEHYAFAGKDVTHGVGGDCTHVNPIKSTLEI